MNNKPKYVTIFKNENMYLLKGHDGFWLYDNVVGMNLGMKAKTEQEAFIEALSYYQRRLPQVLKEFIKFF